MTISTLLYLEACQHPCFGVQISYLPYLSISPKSHLHTDLLCVTYSYVYMLLNYLSILPKRNMRIRACFPSLAVFTSPSDLVSLNCFCSLGEKKVLSEHDSLDLFLGMNLTLDATCVIHRLSVH